MSNKTTWNNRKYNRTPDRFEAARLRDQVVAQYRTSGLRSLDAYADRINVPRAELLNLVAHDRCSLQLKNRLAVIL